MSAKIHSYPLIIKESHLDTFGHVNNATYLTLLEEARWELITQNGFGLKQIQEKQLGPTILEIKIKFLRELHLRDEIVIETQLVSYEKKIGILSQTILRNGKVCCTAELTIALFDLKIRKIISPSKEWLDAINYDWTSP